MKTIIAIIHAKIFNRTRTTMSVPIKQQLGRWTVEYCDRMTRKIDWANHDNCGPCNIQQTQVNNGIYVTNNTGKIHINISSDK